jgi:hypothetical protein
MKILAAVMAGGAAAALSITAAIAPGKLGHELIAWAGAATGIGFISGLRWLLDHKERG